jgi:hypothetical protein
MPTMLDRAGIVDVYETLNKIKGSLDEPMHRFRAAAMRQKFRDLAELIIEERDRATKLAPTAYNEARLSLLNRCAAKDPNGRPVLLNNNYMIDPAKQAEFNEEITKLMATHKEARDLYDAEVAKTNLWLKEEVEAPVCPLKLPLSWFNKSVNQDWFETLLQLDLIEDDTALAHKPAEADVAKAADKKGKQKG